MEQSKKSAPEAGKDPSAAGPKATGGQYREPGLRKLDSTSAFRAINFELYAKPNKFVMAVGLLTVGSCLAYIGYLNLTTDRTKETYMAMDEKDQLQKHYRTSKWD